MLDVGIIGAGPAGLTAAIYAARAHLSAVVLEKGVAGGQISTTGVVDNYPGMPGIPGPELAAHLRAHAEKLGGVLREGDAVKVEDYGTYKQIVLADGETLSARAVIAAAGATPRALGVPGEDVLRGKGVSYCAMCDGAFFRGKRVCVIGGGDSAAEDALLLSRQAKDVVLLHRRDRLRAQKALAAQLMECPNLSIRWNTVVTEILGDGEKVTGIRCCTQGSEHAEELSLDGVFIAVGMQPETGFLKSLGVVGADGCVPAGEDCCTSVPGIFAAGDLRRKGVRQAVTAAADGAAAVRSVQTYLEGANG